MMKKIIVTVILCLSVLFLFTGCNNRNMNIILGERGSGEVKYKIENSEAIVKEAPNLSSTTEIIIADEYEGVPVTKVPDFSCVNLENVAKIHIGKNVKEIGNWAFTNNQKLTTFTVDEENEYFCAVDGVLFTKDMKTIVFYPPAKSTNYTIPDTVETVRARAFYRCEKLESVTIPESVTKIEVMGFFRCSALKELKLPEKLTFIGKDAFSYCSTIKEITIPASVEQIDEYAFYNCTEALKVNVMKAEADIVLGHKWYPTKNGLDIDGFELKFNA